MRFENKTALVTGAGGPMGGAVARRLAGEGADVLITDISGRRLEVNAEKLRAEFPERRIVAHRASVLNFSEVQDLVKHAPGPIDLIANIVGGIRGAFEMPLLEMTDQRWTDTFDLNVKGIIYLARELGPGMRERQYGRIVNISSVAYAGDGRQPDYAAAKAAVVSLTRSMAMELAPHVTVNCIAPGVIATSVTEYADPAFLQTWIDRSLLKRLGTPEDIASVSAFLLSDDASYLTGVMLPVSGGIWPSL